MRDLRQFVINTTALFELKDTLWTCHPPGFTSKVLTNLRIICSQSVYPYWRQETFFFIALLKWGQ